MKSDNRKRSASLPACVPLHPMLIAIRPRGAGSRDQPSTAAPRRYLSEALATVLLLVVAFAEHVLVVPVPLMFLEGDLGLSFPLVRPEAVSLPQLFALSILLPVACILLGHVLQAVRTHATLRSLAVSFAWCALGALQSLTIVFAFVNTLKLMTGRQRPNFFALCDYEGYRNASAAGTAQALADYVARISPGMPGALARCGAPAADVSESLRSFPSGHAGLCWAGMVYATLYLRAAFGVPPGVSITVPSVASCAPLLVAAYVSVSRVRDRWHNTDDVAIGTGIGVFAGMVAWGHYVALRRAGLAPSSGAGRLEGPEKARSLLRRWVSGIGRQTIDGGRTLLWAGRLHVPTASVAMGPCSSVSNTADIDPAGACNVESTLSGGGLGSNTDSSVAIEPTGEDSEDGGERPSQTRA